MVKSRLVPDLGSNNKQTQEMRVSLRGKLAQDYVRLRNNNVEAASKWVRKLCIDAVNGHPQLSYRMEADPTQPLGQRFVVGMTNELGTMGDW